MYEICAKRFFKGKFLKLILLTHTCLLRVAHDAMVRKKFLKVVALNRFICSK